MATCWRRKRSPILRCACCADCRPRRHPPRGAVRPCAAAGSHIREPPALRAKPGGALVAIVIPVNVGGAISSSGDARDPLARGPSARRRMRATRARTAPPIARGRRRVFWAARMGGDAIAVGMDAPRPSIDLGSSRPSRSPSRARRRTDSSRYAAARRHHSGMVACIDGRTENVSYQAARAGQSSRQPRFPWRKSAYPSATPSVI